MMSCRFITVSGFFSEFLNAISSVSKPHDVVRGRPALGDHGFASRVSAP